ncbi:MAG: M1 family aminopeptidase [Bacteroidota bacterium]
MHLFKEILLFEIKYRLKRPSFYVYTTIALLTGMLYGSILSGGLGPETTQSMGVGGNNLANSPILIHTLLLAIAQIAGLFIIAAFMAVPVFRDFQRNAHSLFFTKPIDKISYLGGRFMGSFLIVLFILLFLGVGMAVMIHWPWEDSGKLGPFVLWHYVNPYLVSIFPFAFFTSSIFFAIVTLSRNELFIYLNAIVMLVLFSFASTLSNLVDSKVLASLLDPTGSVAIVKHIEFWTVAEKNTQVIGMFPLLAWNYVIWMGVAIAIIVLTYRNFSFSYARPKMLKSSQKIQERGSIPVNIHLFGRTVSLPKVSLSYTWQNHLSQLWLLTKMELRRIFRSPVLWVMFAVGVLMMILTLLPFVQRMAGMGASTYPVTYGMIGSIVGGFGLFIIAAIIFWTGELVWRERHHRINELMDVLPTPSGINLGSKFIALLSMPVFFLLGGILIAIIAQLVQGYFRIEPGLYLQRVLGIEMIDHALFIVLCLFIQVLSPNKYLGFFICVLAFFGFGSILPSLGVEDRLFRYMSGYRLSYSDMNGYGPFMHPYMSMKAYWLGAAILLGISGAGLYLRGTENNWIARFTQLKQSIRKPVVLGATLLGAALFLGFGSYVYYNTHILNDFLNSKDRNKEQAEYEKKYKFLEGKAQPKITDVTLEVDMFPETQDFHVTGQYKLKNKTATAIDSIVFLPSLGNVEYSKFELSRSLKERIEDDDLGIFLLVLAEALEPGDSLYLDFEGDYQTNGFPNNGLDTRMAENGAFIPHSYFPEIGYNPLYEHTSPEVRKEYGLPKREFRFPPRTDTASLEYTLIARDSDWINFSCTISTEADQIAIAPGYLQKEWEDNGRKYFAYKMDSKMLKFYNLLSGKYEVMKEQFMMYDSIPIDLEIYYHEQHDYNLEAMMDAMKKSLSYYTENFGPYQHKVARILEFPRHHGQFAQSFPNTISYSESAGFIIDAESSDVDMPFYVTAHELAHQWWAHQVVGGAVEGFQFLSESMSQYSAMMVMKKELGEAQIEKYLQHELNQYLKGRGGESRKENPSHMVDQQFYIQYNKGSLVMYALQDYIGEDTLNAAIRRYVDAVKFQEPPFTTTLEWMDYIRAATPDSFQYLLTDLFETITLFENQILETDYEEQNDSSYLVRMKILTEKKRDDGEGEETNIAIKDYIDVGIFARKKVEGEWEDVPLYFQKHQFTQDTTELKILVSSKPSKVGIDPYHKLIDRTTSNNSKRIQKKSN